MGMFMGYKKIIFAPHEDDLIYGLLSPFFCVRLSSLNANKQNIIKEGSIRATTDSNGNIYIDAASYEISVLNAWCIDGIVTVGLTSGYKYIFHCSTWANWNRTNENILLWYHYIEK